MSEKTMRSRVIKALKELHAIPIENHIIPGTPDINYNNGWIELKYIKNWPKNEKTIVSINHFTAQQRRWLENRCQKNGNAYLLLHIYSTKQWLLFTGDVAARYIGSSTKNELESLAYSRWVGFKEKELLECLK